MLFRSRISLLLAILLALLMTVPVFAGGWAVITLDELPSGVVAGEPLSVGFTVRQHGRTLMSGLYPRVTILLGQEKQEFFAQAEGAPGHYTATLVFPKEGEWNWTIEAFTMTQPMPALTVTPAGTTTSPSTKEAAAVSLPTTAAIPIGLTVLGLGVLGMVIGLRRKSRTIMALTALCLFAGIALLVTNVGAEAQAKAEPSGSSLSQVELGRQLFLAKGCITCHTNSKATRSNEYWTIEMGAPNLSKFSASPEALRLRLKDPAEVKSDTMMPNLELKETEIEALIAFINSK